MQVLFRALCRSFIKYFIERYHCMVATWKQAALFIFRFVTLEKTRKILFCSKLNFKKNALFRFSTSISILLLHLSPSLSFCRQAERRTEPAQRRKKEEPAALGRVQNPPPTWDIHVIQKTPQLSYRLRSCTAMTVSLFSSSPCSRFSHNSSTQKFILYQHHSNMTFLIHQHRNNTMYFLWDSVQSTAI